MPNPFVDARAFSEDDLFSILNSEKYSDLLEYFTEEKLKTILLQTRQIAKFSGKYSKISQSILGALTDTGGYPLLLGWYVVGMVTFEIISIVLVTTGIFFLTLALGGYYIFSTHKELKKESEKTEQKFMFSLIQSLAADELLDRQRKILKIPAPITAVTPFVFNDKHKHTRIKQTIGISTFVAATLFTSYYLGIGAIVGAFGVSAMLLTGPIGIAIALATCLLIASFFGYKFYQANKNKAILKQQHKELKLDVKQKHKECITLQKMIFHKKAARKKMKNIVPHSYRKKHRGIKHKSYFANNPSILLAKPTLKSRFIYAISNRLRRCY